jgi:hypothetical protein
MKIYPGVCRRLAMVLVPALFLLSARASGAVSYTFTTIAETHGLFQSFSPAIPTLNRTGDVVFWAALKAGGEGIFLGSGGPPLTLYDTHGDFSDFGIFPAVNNQGQVAFRAGSKTGGGGIFRGHFGEPATLVTDEGDNFDLSGFGSFVGINDQGTLVFKEEGPRVHDYHLSRVLTTQGWTLTTVYGPTDLGTLEVPLTINNSGLVAPYGLLGKGGPIRQKCGPFTSLNDNGVVACGDAKRILTVDGTTVTHIAHAKGLFRKHGFVPLSVSINNHNLVAFAAALKAGGAGIFMGDRRTTDPVITTGAPLLGSTVVAFRFLGPKALNDNGQVAFLALLADGTEGIFRADPGP